jgi:hypothetical protein
LAAAAVPLAIASGVVSAAGALQQGAAASAQANYEGQVAKQNAAQTVDAYRDYRGQVVPSEQRDFWRKVGQIKGQNIAAMAANGIDVSVGSAARLQEDTQSQANEDFQNLAANETQKMKGYTIDASNFVSEAKAARARASQAKIGSYFGAAGSLLGGLSQAAGMKAKMGGG